MRRPGPGARGGGGHHSRSRHIADLKWTIAGLLEGPNHRRRLRVAQRAQLTARLPSGGALANEGVRGITRAQCTLHADTMPVRATMSIVLIEVFSLEKG